MIGLNLKQAVVEAIDRTTIHGIYEIYSAESMILKKILILCFLVSAGNCIYQIVTTLFSSWLTKLMWRRMFTVKLQLNFQYIFIFKIEKFY